MTAPPIRVLLVELAKESTLRLYEKQSFVNEFLYQRHKILLNFVILHLVSSGEGIDVFVVLCKDWFAMAVVGIMITE